MRSLLLTCCAVLTLAAAGCGGSDNASETTPVPTTTLPTTSQTTPTTTTPAQTATTTTPSSTTGAATNTTTSPSGTTTTPTQPTGGVAPEDDTGGTSADDSSQDPDCKPGTGPGQPNRQCEPVNGPDAMDEGPIG